MPEEMLSNETQNTVLGTWQKFPEPDLPDAPTDGDEMIGRYKKYNRRGYNAGIAGITAGST